MLHATLLLILIRTCLSAPVLLQLLHHGAFMVLLYAAARVIFSCIHHTVRVGKLLQNILQAIHVPARWVRPVLMCSLAFVCVQGVQCVC